MEIHSPDPEALASEGLQGDELVEPYSALDRTDVWVRHSSNETRDALLRRVLAASDRSMTVNTISLPKRPLLRVMILPLAKDPVAC